MAEAAGQGFESHRRLHKAKVGVVAGISPLLHPPSPALVRPSKPRRKQPVESTGCLLPFPSHSSSEGAGRREVQRAWSPADAPRPRSGRHPPAAPAPPHGNEAAVDHFIAHKRLDGRPGRPSENHEWALKGRAKEFTAEQGFINIEEWDAEAFRRFRAALASVDRRSR
jgi:hypothetical protein